MAASDPSPPRARLAGRLAAARRFVGRQAELELFRAALAADPPPFAVLHVVGPGGIGKSSLLRQYAHQAAESGRPTFLIDCRNVDTSPTGFLEALSLALDGAAHPLDVLAGTGRPVLLLDTCEMLAPLDGWLREWLLPQLPDDALVVMAGRNMPHPAWRTESGWRDLARIISLRNLRPEESQAYLDQRGLPPPQHRAILDSTHGHPLALSLVADVAAQSGSAVLPLDQAPDLVAVLLERFVQAVPTAQHRLALHACATARVLNEPLLRAALGQEDVQAIFAWLRSLSFVEQGPYGLFPHDLARDVLDSDLRWRDPAAYEALHWRLLDVLAQRILKGHGHEQMRSIYDLVYLHRHNPILQPYYHWTEFGTLYHEPVRAAEHAALLARVASFASGEAADLAEFWLARQPEAWHLVRDPQGSIVGAFMVLALHATTAEDRQHDPAVAAAWHYAQRHAPLRPGDQVTLARYFADPASYFTPSPEMNTAQLAVGLHWMTTPNLAWAFCDVHDPDHWLGIMGYYDFHRVPGTPHGLFAHDWRATPVLAWITLIGQRALATGLDAEDLVAASTPPLVALSQPEFEDAVKSALRDYRSPDLLAANPLLRSRAVRDRSDGSPSVQALQSLLREAAASLPARPKDAKYLRALDATYFTPAGTQELAAERLGLPFSTFRYHLTQGVERLTAWLWQRELYGFDA